MRLTQQEIEAVEQLHREAITQKSEIDLVAYISNLIGVVGVEAQEGWYREDINDTHVSFYFMEDGASEYSDDTEEIEEYYIQVDLWSSEDCYKLKKKIKKVLQMGGFGYIAGNDQFEIKTGLYHKSMRIYYTIEV